MNERKQAEHKDSQNRTSKRELPKGRTKDKIPPSLQLTNSPELDASAVLAAAVHEDFLDPALRPVTSVISVFFGSC